MSGVEVRRLDLADLARAPGLLAPEGWTFSVDELARLHRLGGAVGAFSQDGRMLGYLSHVDFPPVRWVGNVVVHPDARGAGVGARMVDLAAEGARTMGLYAVEKAVTLYERAGFRAHGEAWALRASGGGRPKAPSVTQPMQAEDLREAARLDRESTGMDRGYLLRELLAAYPDTARVVRRGGRLLGFGFVKTSPDVEEVGPLVAIDAATVSAILDALLALTKGPHEMAALGANRDALPIAAARGFVPSFRTVVMFRGEPPAWRPRRLFAAAGLEKG